MTVLSSKKAIVESINNQLQNICQIKHPRRRSFNNLVANLISEIEVHCFLPKKLAIKIQFEKQTQLFLF